MDLPSFIIVAILSRLPIRTLLQCRCIFNNVRLARSAFINIVFRVHNGFYLLELGHDHDCNYTHQPHGPMWFKNPLKLGHDSKYAHQPMWLPHANAIEPHRPMCFRMTFYIPHRELELVGSCNGLLCFSDYYQTIDRVYIVNPIFGEYVALPKPEYKVIRVAYGFGFGCSSGTGQYKVLMIISKTVEVCTLTSGTWRKLGDAPFQLLVNQCGVTLNGAVHWIVPCSECIYSFDIDEQFHPIPLPPNFENG
ncbi:F-box protein At3g07870-like [Cornus florida]|uniref:F-box protein At3g07870-like n=1 Tax=Cornus florida TaxID=4283 RepID=UPI00289DCBF3|nr:F-box protein At3g07870-like [Cornus florida]